VIEFKDSTLFSGLVTRGGGFAHPPRAAGKSCFFRWFGGDFTAEHQRRPLVISPGRVNLRQGEMLNPGRDLRGRRTDGSDLSGSSEPDVRRLRLYLGEDAKVQKKWATDERG